MEARRSVDSSMASSRARVRIIYTGGTIGMKAVGGVYRPVPGYLAERISAMPEFARPELPELSLHELSPLLDSANMRPRNWQLIAEDLAQSYDDHDGFVVIHGTDTMAYTAAALSFLLEGLAKPVILTGSQIPLAEVRSDARENLITSLLLASDPRIAEVCLYLSGALLRGNRATKVSASGFEAFASPNFPLLGTVGVDIALRLEALRAPSSGPLRVGLLGAAQVAVLRVVPGLNAALLGRLVSAPLGGLVLETYGAGNAPADDPDLLRVLGAACAAGLVVVNCSQCLHGRVTMDEYATGRALAEAGVTSGHDLTVEAALAKLHYLFGQGLEPDAVRAAMARDLRGELSPD